MDAQENQSDRPEVFPEGLARLSEAGQEEGQSDGQASRVALARLSEDRRWGVQDAPQGQEVLSPAAEEGQSDALGDLG